MNCIDDPEGDPLDQLVISAKSKGVPKKDLPEESEFPDEDPTLPDDVYLSGLKAEIQRHLERFAAYQIFPRGLQKNIFSMYIQDADFIHGDGLNTPDIEGFDDRLRHLSCPLLMDIGVTLKSVKNPKNKSSIEDYIETGDIDLLYTIFNSGTPTASKPYTQHQS